MRKLFWVVLMTVIGLQLTPVNSVDCACIDPPIGLVAWWPGDGTPENIVGEATSGFLHGNAAFAAGVVGQAFSFDGAGDYMTTPSVINGWAEGTIDLWVKFISLGGDPVQIFSAAGIDPVGATYYPIQLWADNGSAEPGFFFSFQICEKDLNTAMVKCDWWPAYAAGSIQTETWYHLAGTWGADGLKIYVDGDLIVTNSGYKGPAPNTFSNIIGAPVLSHKAFNGLADEVEIFDRALSPGEIAAIFNAGSAEKCKTSPNSPPVAKCKDVTVAAGLSCSAEASINAGSSDPDGNPITLTQSPAGPYSLGDNLVTLTVTDSHGAASSCSGTVTVKDMTPPRISKVTAIPSMLWPPNHKMVPVGISIEASDKCGEPIKCEIVSVTSNEPVNGLGDGDTAPDWQFYSTNFIVNLRAERSGQGSGRVYTVGAQCGDKFGNLSTGKVQVRVPHDQRAPRDSGGFGRQKAKKNR